MLAFQTNACDVLFCYLFTDVTGKAIEETAAVLLRLYHDRKNKCTMSKISKRY